MRPGTALFVISPLFLVVAAFVFVATRGAGAGPHVDGVYWSEDIVRFVRRRIAQTYVDQLDESRSAQAFYRAMDAYVHELDDYCDFIPPDERRRQREATKGEYAGLGVKVEEVPEGVVIVGLLPEGPAAKAGLKRGDTIIAADQTSLAKMALRDIEATQLLKGPPGTRVVLSVLSGPRPAQGPPPGPALQVPVLRAVVRPPTVFARRVGVGGRFGVIRLTEFAEATEADFDQALKELMAAGVQGLLLDLRHNGGGVLPTAVGVADRFLRRGVIVRMEGRAPNSNQRYDAHPENVVSDTLPLAVLVDHRSASASEVVAGALQDHRRALLVGERTYGKFLVQQITDIPGTDAAVSLTTSRYYLPSGRSYQRSRDPDRGRLPDLAGNGVDDEPAGILPDVVVPLTSEEREVLRKSWENEEARPWGEERPNPDVPVDHVDPQTTRALELLQGQLALRRIRGEERSGRPQ